MRIVRLAVVVAGALATSAIVLPAQQSADSTARRQQRMLDSLTIALAALQSRLDSLSSATSAGSTAQSAPARTSGAYMNVGFVSLADAGWSTEPNVTSLLTGDHDPKVRGFTMPNSELSLDGAVDPYFKGFSNIVLKIGEDGETGIELEEAYLLTTSLPANLQLKAGQFFAEFGRQNPQHPHAWAFVDQPLVFGEMFGPDGLRSQGIRLSWLAPTPFYTEAMVALVNSSNGTAFSFRSDESSEIHGGTPIERPVLGFKDMLVVPRIASSFDLTETQTVVIGASAAIGPNNSGPSANTQIYGVDGYWKWKSVTAEQGFPFVSLQAEALTRRYDAAQRTAVDAPSTTLPAEVLRDHGGYAQLLWGIKPRIVAGIRGDVVRSSSASFTTALRTDRVRISPNLSWYPTEFSKLRLQYNFDDRKGIGTDHSLWVQFEFLLGAHAAHKF